MIESSRTREFTFLLIAAEWVATGGFVRIISGSFYLALAMVANAQTANAQDAINYEYDALGRLTSAKTTNGVANGKERYICYDPAGNRTTLITNTTAGTGCTSSSSPSPTPTPTPTTAFTINNVSVSEGGSLLFTVTRTGSSAGTHGVSWATADGSANSSDYHSGSGSLTFAAGETSKSITVQTKDDNVYEPANTVLVNLASATNGATISDSQGIGTIVDTDSPPAILISDVQATEPAHLIFDVTLSGPSEYTHEVNFSAIAGSAEPSDFVADSDKVTFNPLEQAKVIDIDVNDDTIHEPNDTVLVNLSNPTNGAQIGDNQGVGTIIDNDPNNAPTSVAIFDSGLCYEVTEYNIVYDNFDPDEGQTLSLTYISPGAGPAIFTMKSSTTLEIEHFTKGTTTGTYTITDGVVSRTGTIEIQTVGSTTMCSGGPPL